MMVYWHTREREDEEETRVSLLYSRLYLKLFTGLSKQVGRDYIENPSPPSS